MDKHKRGFQLLAILVLLGVAIGIVNAATEDVTTIAYFTVPENLEFEVWFPGNVNCTSSATGTCTNFLNFTSSTGGNTKYANCTVQGGSAQDDTTACFRIDNTGTVNLNMSMSLNASEPSGVDVWAAKTFAGMTDATFVDINTTYWIFNSSLIPAHTNATVWVWVNFTAASAGVTNVNMTIRGIS